MKRRHPAPWYLCLFVFYLFVFCLFGPAMTVGSAQQLRAPAAPTFVERVPATIFAGFAEQTVPQNPDTVEFTSTDHNAVVDGVAVVTRYDVEIYGADGAGTALKVVDIGKPTTASTTVTYAQLKPILAGMNGRFTLKVNAVGSGGASRSAASDPFRQVGPPALPSKPTVR